MLINFIIGKSWCRMYQTHLPYYSISILQQLTHQRDPSQPYKRSCEVSCVTVRQTTQTNSNTPRSGGAGTLPPPNNTVGVTLSVVYPHRARQGQQLFVWVNPNYSLDHHEKASALTSNTKSLKNKGFHFFLCFRCQHSKRSRGPRRKRRKDNGI